MTSTSSATSSPIASTGPASPRPSSSSREPTASSSRCRACRTPNRSATSSARPWLVVPRRHPGEPGPGPRPRGTALLLGEQVDSAAIGADPNTNARVVTFVLKSEGAQLFEQYTRDHTGEFFAIVLDGEVISAPEINRPIRRTRPDHLRLHRGFPLQEAQNLVTVLEFGSLPFDRGAGQHDDQPHARRRVPAAEPHRRSHRHRARHRVHDHPVPAAGVVARARSSITRSWSSPCSGSYR